MRDPAHGLIAVPVAAAATAGYLAALAGVAFLLEIESSVSALVLREALIGMLLNVAIALPFFGLARRVLRPVLVVDPLERPRRRRSTTRRSPGPLGLRGLGA